MSEDQRPTPPAGMPAAEVIDASRPDLRTIVREAVREELQPLELRVGELARRVEQVDGRVTDLDGRVGKQFAEQATAMAAVAQAAANAANHALEAKRTAAEADGNAKTIVESALRIHAASIAVTVDKAVQQSMQPVKDDVGRIDGSQREANEAIGAIVEELGIEDRVKLGREVKPGEKRQLPTLQKIERRAKSSTIVQAVIAAGVIAEVIARLLWPQNVATHEQRSLPSLSQPHERP